MSNKQKTFKTKEKLDGSIEIEVKKSPSKTLSGKIVIALIIIGTLLVPLALLIYYLVQAM